MPTATNDGTRLYYETEGEGATVAFVGDVGLGAWQWGWQHAAVAGPYEALVWDLRGTGRSDAPPGPYAVETLAADLEAVLGAAGTRTAHLVGAGLGGMVALAHARQYGRARSLTLIGTSPGGPDADLAPDLVDRLYAPPDDPAALRASLSHALSGSFRADHGDVLDGVVAWRRTGDADESGWCAQAAAFHAFDAADWLHEVGTPALVLHGGDDELVPATNAGRLAAGLPRAEAETFPGAGHWCFVERSRPVNDRLLGFLDANSPE